MSVAPPRPSDVLAKLAPAGEDATVWVRVGTLLDGVRTEPLRDAHLVYGAHGIRHVGTGAQAPGPEILSGQTRPDIELPHHTVMPGLIEAHAHLFLDGAPLELEARKQYLAQTPQWMLTRAQERLGKLLECGVMAVRDAGDRVGVGLKLRDAYRRRRSQDTPAPYVDSPGAAIHHRGRYGSFMSDPLEDHANPEACVAARVAAGADRIKLIATGIINFKAGRVTAPPQMSAQELGALMAAARTHERPTFAHASGDDGIENVIEAGVDSVEHGYFIREDQLARMRDKELAWVPTFAPVQVQIDEAATMGWDNQVVEHLKRIIEGHATMLRRAHEMGVRVVAGSDAGSCGVPHGLGLIREMELMEQAGMPPSAVLNAATGTSAHALGFGDPIGRLQPECRTRLIFTRHCPLDGVANLRRPKILVFDGIVMQSDCSLSTEGL